MEQNYDKSYWNDNKCPKYDCRKNSCKCGLKSVFLSSALGDDSEGSPIAPKNGAYCNAIVVYEANGSVYIYSKEGIPTLVERDIENLEKVVAKEILDRQAADNTLQGEIDAIKNSPDVVDIVATYAALQVYDTSHLGDNDIIRVLADETHDGQSTYYRWDKQNSSWTYIGSIPAINVVQTTGTSQSDVMSQNAVTSTIFADPGTNKQISIGNVSSQIGNRAVGIGDGCDASGSVSVAIGVGNASGAQSIAIGSSARALNVDAIAIGRGASSASGAITIGGHSFADPNEGATGRGSIALGYGAKTTKQGEINVSTDDQNFGYNSTNYRLLSGIYDGQSAHDAATLVQGNTLSTSAPDTSTVGVLGQLYTDTTTMHTYQCTAIDTTDPSNPSYIWTQRW